MVISTRDSRGATNCLLLCQISRGAQHDNDCVILQFDCAERFPQVSILLGPHVFRQKPQNQESQSCGYNDEESQITESRTVSDRLSRVIQCPQPRRFTVTGPAISGERKAQASKVVTYPVPPRSSAFRASELDILLEL